MRLVRSETETQQRTDFPIAKRVYLCVADGARARRELGFAPRLSIKRTILDFLGVEANADAAPAATAPVM